MKTKRIITGIISGVVCLSVMTACTAAESTSASKAEKESSQSSAEESKTEESKAEESKQEAPAAEETKLPEPGKSTLTIRDQGKSAEMTATFLNNQSGSTEDVKMEKTGEGDGYYIYTCEGDTSKYNTVHLTAGDTVTKDFAFNFCESGWNLYQGEPTPYVVGSEGEFELKYETKSFTFNDVERDVHIWAPDDYDADSAEKCSTIYMLDGQTVLTTEITNTINRSWNVAQHTAAMKAATGRKAVLVCIEAAERDDEYTPSIGEKVNAYSTKNPIGDKFGDFVCDTIIPYIQENYNVYTDAAHTSVAGSSLGGIEAFYIGMEHPDKFGTTGVFSPSFWVYDEKDWKAYFKSKTYGGDSSFLYFYSGSYGKDTGYCAEPMFNALIDSGYPKDKLVFSKYESAEHNEEYWSYVYPEFLEAALCKGVYALESGAKVKYIDRTPPDNAEMIEQLLKDRGEDNRPDYIKNYVFFDNSETKWDRVCAYWFGLLGDLPMNKATEEKPYGNQDWPGLEMQQIEGTDLWVIAAPVNVSSIIFSNGILDKQVKDGVTAYQTDDLIYTDVAFSGMIYTIDTSVEPTSGTGFEKTKFKYSAGNWIDYTGGDWRS